MIKKLLKYGKILMALTLIGALSLPSYATVGASDGSAFVTKAEFDAALSDFNARLTTFEAGINSKIDSQVSSYLDRNGIWNGKDQTLSNDAKAGFILSFASNNTSESCYCVKYNGASAEGKSVYKMNKTVQDIWGSNSVECTGTPEVISSITKSGLIALDCEYRNFAGSGKTYTWAYSYCTQGFSDARYNQKLEDVAYMSNNYWTGYMLTLNWGADSSVSSSARLTPLVQTKYELQIGGITKYALTTLDYSSWNVGLYQGVSSTSAVRYFMNMPTDSHSTRSIVYFFVHKGDCLKIKPTKMFAGSWTDLYMASNSSNQSVGTVLKFHDANIY